MLLQIYFSFTVMTSTVVKAKFKDLAPRDEKATYVGNICVPRMPMVSGMPSIVNVYENNICNFVVENCAPYDVTFERDNILGIMETEEEELVPFLDDFISSVCQDIHNCFPKVKRKRLVREEIKRNDIWIFCANTRMLSALTNTIWAWQKFHAQDTSQDAGSSLPEAFQNPRGASPIHQTNPG